MDILNTNNKSKSEKQKARRYYAHIGRPWCPNLNDYVAFNTMGFHHLMRKKGILRTESEQTNRFHLLPNAVTIIADSNSVFIHERSKTISRAEFWVCKKRSEEETITVIIRKLGNGEKHFFSIFSDKK